MNAPCLPHVNYMVAATRLGLPRESILGLDDWLRWHESVESDPLYQREEPAQMTPSELMEAYPEGAKLARTLLRARRAELKETETVSAELLAGMLEWAYAVAAPAKLSQAAIDWLTKEFYTRPINEVQRHVKRLEHLVRIDEWKRKPTGAGEITDADVAQAKTVPIGKWLPTRSDGFAKCPFHDEKTGSMKVYKDNRYHCFGCGADGDVIDLVMKLAGLGFIPAVRHILNA